MLRSCPYCGRVHDTRFDCGKKPHKPWRKVNDTESRRFRSTHKWGDMSIIIRQRDRYLCAWCEEKLGILNTQGVEVHHIVPIKDDWDKRLDRENLISLCREHHEDAEKGKIKASELIEIAREREADAGVEAFL